MSTELKPGDKVAWRTPQGETHGTVEKKVTSTTKVKGHVAKATKAHPQYEVKSDRTGAEAVHARGALHKR
jgi:N-methylhydantoinase B/oxoprolinase/acetone carboxylase alpha subunit